MFFNDKPALILCFWTMTRREMQINQVYHSCYSFFIINFALAKSKTVRQP